MGRKGGRRKIPVRKTGSLRKHGYSIHKGVRARHAALKKAIEEQGAVKVFQRLHAQVQLREEAGVPGPKPRKGVEKAWEIFRADRDWVAQQMSQRQRRSLTAKARKSKRGKKKKRGR